MIRILTEANFISLVAHFHSYLLSTGFLRLHFVSVRKNARCGLEVRVRGAECGAGCGAGLRAGRISPALRIDIFKIFGCSKYLDFFL